MSHTSTTPSKVVETIEYYPNGQVKRRTVITTTVVEKKEDTVTSKNNTTSNTENTYAKQLGIPQYRDPYAISSQSHQLSSQNHNTQATLLVGYRNGFHMPIGICYPVRFTGLVHIVR